MSDIKGFWVKALALFTAFHLLFAVWPGIDLWVSGLFFNGEAFPVASNPAIEVLRRLLRFIITAAGLACLVGWALAWLQDRWLMIPARLWAWASLVFLLGPGLLVNGIFKSTWGRARPADVAEFGGTATFTPPFEMAAECAKNCSFTSGEGAGAMAFALVTTAFARSWQRWPWHRFVVPLAWGIAGLLMLHRIAAGRHFLSDTVFSVLFVGLIAVALAQVMGLRRSHRAQMTGPTG